MKILVPTDYSVPGSLACKFAADMALLYDGEVSVMKTADSFFVPELVLHEEISYKSQRTRRLNNEYRSFYKTLVDQHPGSRSLNLIIELGPVTIVEPMQQLLIDHEIDLVVAATNGDVFCEEYIGTDTALHLGVSPLPIATIRKGSRANSITDIVLPISMTTGNASFVLSVRALQKRTGARLHLVLVKTELFDPSDIKGQQYAEAFARHYRMSNYSTSIRTSRFLPGTVLDYAVAIDADIILWGMQ